jgi:hypothetical protein
MIVSVHIASLGGRAALAALRRPPEPVSVPGLRYAETTITAPISGGTLPRPRLDRIGLIAAWDDDAALDEFSDSHPLAERLAAGWMTRLEPLRVSGAWPEMPGLPEKQLPVDDEEPVRSSPSAACACTAVPFLRSAAAAESEAAAEPDVLASAGMARPPQLVSTFSLWRTAAAMRDYSYRSQGAHQAAVRSDRARPFHHRSAFVRFRPYASRGSWDGRDPLAGLVPATS